MRQLTRREWHTLTFGSLVAAVRLEAQVARPNSRFAGVQIGIQSYSLRDRDLDGVVAAMVELGLNSCELWEAHVEPPALRRPEAREALRRWRLTVPLAHFEQIRSQVDRAGLELSAYNLSFKDHFSDEEIARGFEMAAALGVDVITSSANMNSVHRIAPLARRHGITVAMHNHSRIDPNEFATPDDFARAMRIGGDAPIAINLDIGHFTAANLDPVAFLRDHHQDIATIHLKDRRREQGPNVPWGEGDTPIRKVLALLRDERWPIPANIEYEYRGDDTVTEIRRCLDYCRQALGA